MSYENDGLLVIAAKYGKARGDAQAMLYETYDQIRDSTVAGTTNSDPTGYGGATKFMLNFARMFAPASFAPVLSGSSMVNIPGTSYSSPITGGNSMTFGGTSVMGYGSASNYAGITGGAASIYSSVGSMAYPNLIGDSSVVNNFTQNTVGGVTTGAAASLVDDVSYASGIGAMTGITTAAGGGGSIALPVAGFMSGVGGLLQTVAPYTGVYSLAPMLAGKTLNAFGSAILGTFQDARTQIANNGGEILEGKVLNIETIVKQLDTQTDVIKKMLKESIDADSKALQNLS